MENDYSYFTEKIHHLENRVDNLEKLVMQLSNHLLLIEMVKKIDEEQNPYKASPWYYANEWE